MGDTRPLTNSEVHPFSTMDLVDSPNDLNNSDDISARFRNNKSSSTSILSPYNINGRLIVIIIAVGCFILSLILFIGTVVVGMGSSCPDSVVLASKHSAAVSTPPTLQTTTTLGQVGVTDAAKTTQLPPNVDTPSVTQVNGINSKRPGQLVWFEEFDSFNTTKWQHLNHDPSSNFFHFVNTRNNSFVKDGFLYLKPTYTADAYGEDYVYNGTMLLGRKPSEICKKKNDSALCWKGDGLSIVHPIMAPAISTQESFSFKYGVLEIRAKMPAGDWVEPLMSLQPKESFYGTDLLNGQVQMIDTRGNRQLFDHNGVNVGSEQTCPDIRLGSHKTKRYLFDCLNTKNNEGFDTDFHLYQVEWTPDSITLKIDGNGIVSAPFPRKSMYELWSRGRVHTNPWATAENAVMAPFDRHFYLVLGINVGGVQGFFSDDFSGPYPKPWKDSDMAVAAKSFWENRHDWEPSWGGDAAAMQIDYVRLYALNQTVSSD